MSDKPIEKLNFRFGQGCSCATFLFSTEAAWPFNTAACNPAPFRRYFHTLPLLHIW